MESALQRNLEDAAHAAAAADHGDGVTVTVIILPAGIVVNGVRILEDRKIAEGRRTITWEEARRAHTNPIVESIEKVAADLRQATS